MKKDFPIYLDYMASTPIDKNVLQKMLPYFTYDDGLFANPASQHTMGLNAKRAVENAANQVAKSIHAEATEIIWTSGATESTNLAIKGIASFYQRKGKHIITSQIEHKATLACCQYLEEQGFSISYLAVDKYGKIDLDELSSLLTKNTILVSLAHVNSEIGTIQDISRIADITHRAGALLHVDAAQSLGKLALDVKKMEIDLLSVSAHKFYGPKGIGFLYVRSHPKIHLQPLIHGGSQQLGLRSGTLPTPLIVGLGEACQLADSRREQDFEHALHLKKIFLKRMESIGIQNYLLNGDLKTAIPHVLNISFPGVHGEALHSGLCDIAVAASSACTTHRFQTSHVLQAIGLKEYEANSSLRISFGRYTSEEDIDFAVQSLAHHVKALQKLSPLENSLKNLNPSMTFSRVGEINAGGIIELNLAWDEKERVAQANYRVYGDTTLLMSSEIFFHSLIGCLKNDLHSLSIQDVMYRLALPQTKNYIAALLFQVLLLNLNTLNGE